MVTSLMNMTRTVFSSWGGWLADHMDWISYFVLTTVAAIPGLIVLLMLIKRLPIQDTYSVH